MSHNKWIISDTHFGHANIIKYCNRPFADVEEMNEKLVDNWNKVVQQQDVVYHLGDVVMNKKWLPILDRLNGSKRLILGNHDMEIVTEYLKYFKRVYAMRIFGDMIFTHIPIHTSQFYRFKFNVHGHIHTYNVQDEYWGKPDNRYLNVSVEQINYTPISFDRISEIRRECGV